MQTLTRMDMAIIKAYYHLTTNYEWKCKLDETNTYDVKFFFKP